MQPLALQVIRDEHQALAAMLRSLGLLLSKTRRENQAPDFWLIRAMLFYLDEFAERLHHQKESELLFPAVRAQAPELGAVLDRLDDDHARGEQAIRELEHDLLAFEVVGEERRAKFEKAFEAYSRSYLEHMAAEEQHVLPAAQRLLSAEQWSTLDAAFESNRDPLTGHPPADVYRPIFDRILNNLPAPLGLG